MLSVKVKKSKKYKLRVSKSPVGSVKVKDGKKYIKHEKGWRLMKSEVYSPGEVKELLEKGRKGYSVGTVREWKGHSYKKTAPGKWARLYNGKTKGEIKEGGQVKGEKKESDISYKRDDEVEVFSFADGSRTREWLKGKFIYTLEDDKSTARVQMDDGRIYVGLLKNIRKTDTERISSDEDKKERSLIDVQKDIIIIGKANEEMHKMGDAIKEKTGRGLNREERDGLQTKILSDPIVKGAYDRLKNGMSDNTKEQLKEKYGTFNPNYIYKDNKKQIHKEAGEKIKRGPRKVKAEPVKESDELIDAEKDLVLFHSLKDKYDERLAELEKDKKLSSEEKKALSNEILTPELREKLNDFMKYGDKMELIREKYGKGKYDGNTFSADIWKKHKKKLMKKYGEKDSSSKSKNPIVSEVDKNMDNRGTRYEVRSTENGKYTILQITPKGKEYTTGVTMGSKEAAEEYKDKLIKEKNKSYEVMDNIEKLLIVMGSADEQFREGMKKIMDSSAKSNDIEVVRKFDESKKDKINELRNKMMTPELRSAARYYEELIKDSPESHEMGYAGKDFKAVWEKHKTKLLKEHGEVDVKEFSKQLTEKTKKEKSEKDSALSKYRKENLPENDKEELRNLEKELREKQHDYANMGKREQKKQLAEIFDLRIKYSEKFFNMFPTVDAFNESKKGDVETDSMKRQRKNTGEGDDKKYNNQYYNILKNQLEYAKEEKKKLDEKSKK